MRLQKKFWILQKMELKVEKNVWEKEKNEEEKLGI